MGFLRGTKDLLDQKKSESISSPEQNYFLHFALRYPADPDFDWNLKISTSESQITFPNLPMYIL